MNSASNRVPRPFNSLAGAENAGEASLPRAPIGILTGDATKLEGGAFGVPGFKPMRYEDRVPIQVLIVSSNSRLHQGILEKLEPPLWNAIVSESAAQAFEVLTKSSSDEGIMLLDEVLPDLEPNEFRGMVRLRFPQIQVLTLNSDSGHLLVGCDSPNPVSSRLVNLINRTGVVESFPRPPAARPVRRPSPEGVVPLRGMIGDSEPMQRAYGLTRMVAVRDTTVLVTGESGTGKDLIAQEIHQISQRRKQPFVVVNCSAIPETLLEAELFGYSKGSFTGALQSRIGRVHAAHGGTLFLDEIGDMPLSLQGKILRFLEQGEVQRLGGNDNLKVDVRVVAATNADLKSLAAKQQFREDLYYRLAVFPIHLAPLRERKGDLEALAVAFAEKFLPGVEVSRAALSVLEQYDWPGNVRELRNVMERSTILVGAGREIKSEHICI